MCLRVVFGVWHGRIDQGEHNLQSTSPKRMCKKAFGIELKKKKKLPTGIAQNRDEGARISRTHRCDCFILAELRTADTSDLVDQGLLASWASRHPLKGLEHR